MTNKKLEKGSEYEKYDADGDGIVTDDEIAVSERLQQLSVMHEKADAQRNMCWLALLGMLLYPSLVVFCDLLKLQQAAEILGSMASVYYVAVAGLVSVWFSAQAWSNTKNGK